MTFVNFACVFLLSHAYEGLVNKLLSFPPSLNCYVYDLIFVFP